MSDTIADKLSYLARTKGVIQEALEARGVTIPEGTPFRGYGALIGLIASDGVAMKATASRGNVGKGTTAMNCANFSFVTTASAEITE